MPNIDRDIAMNSKVWAFEEARKVLARIEKKEPEKGYVLFETGYGPSGLPHIGTFGEVARTTMVRQAFQTLSDYPTRLFAFSDDMDGLRKVPGNVPNQEMLTENLNKPLTKVPDPFEKYESFAHHNNAKLCEFLDSFGFDYEFKSSTECYKSGMFNAALIRMLERYDEIMRIMLPSLGEERQATYSPFLPISPKTGRVLQVPMLETNPSAGTIVFEDEDGTKTELPVTDGNVKLQWKPDWGMRWYALDVDYEMSGKDLIESVKLSSRICKALGSAGPETFSYELFLDDKGQKISKSKGNGLSMEEWMRYAPHESLALYMFQKPKTAKRLYFDVIPKAVDEYITFAEKMPSQSPEEQLQNPVWYIHGGALPNDKHTPISFALLLNLASVANADNKDILWAYIKRYSPDANPENAPFLDHLTQYAVNYYEDFVKPAKQYRMPDAREEAALRDLAARIKNLPADADLETVQTEVFSAGKENGYDPSELRTWFQAIYEVLLGQSQGPRFGSFIQLYGPAETITLIEQALDGAFVKAA